MSRNKVIPFKENARASFSPIDDPLHLVHQIELLRNRINYVLFVDIKEFIKSHPELSDPKFLKIKKTIEIYEKAENNPFDFIDNSFNKDG